MNLKTKLISVFSAAAMLTALGTAAGAEGNVAEVNGTAYPTLQAAINAAENGAEIDLTADTAEDISIAADKNVVIDLNGCKITNDTDHTITNSGTLTVKDDSEGKTGVVDSAADGKAAVYNASGAKAALESGKYERSETGAGSYYTVENRGTMTIGTENSAPEIYSAAEGSSNIRNYGESAENVAVMTITDAVVSGGMNAVKNDENGNLTINGGTFENVCEQGSVILNGAKAVITGGEFIGSGANVIYTAIGDDQSGQITSRGDTTVTGGTFTAQEGTDVFAVDINASAAVTGGTFSDTVNSEYIDEAYMTVKNEDGTYTVAKLENEEQYAAKIESMYFHTVKAAIEEAEPRKTAHVKLLKDVFEDVVIPQDKKIYIYLQGHTLTNMSEHTITNYGFLSVYGDTGKGGKVDNITHRKAAVYNAPGATAYLMSGTYTRSAEAGSASGDNGGNSFYVIQNQGTMSIFGAADTYGETKIESTSKYSSLVANGWQNGIENESGKTANLTIKGGTFSGGVNTIKNDDWGVLTITSGTFENMTQHALLNWNITNISGGTFIVSEEGYYAAANGYLNDTMDQGKLTITGGNFTTGVAVNGDSEKAAEGINISGGTFGADVSDYLAEGCAISDKYVVLNPANDAGRVSGEGVYKSAVKDDKYEQLQIFGTSGLTSGEVSFKIKTTDENVANKEQTANFKYDIPNADGSVKIGLIITEIPADASVTAEISAQ